MKFIQKAFLKHSNKVFLEGKLNKTYLDFYRDVVKNIPLQENKIALLPISDGYSAFTIYMSCILQSVIPIMVPEQLGKSKIKKYISLYNPDYIFTKTDQNNFIELSSYKKIEKNIFNFSYNFYENKKLTTRNIKNTVLLLSTSGSTGDPKLVKLSEYNLKKNTDAIIKSLGINFKDTVALSLPLNYSFGLSVVHSHIVAGTKIILSDPSILGKEFWSDFIKYDVRCFYGVPYQYEILKKLKVFSKISKKFRFFAQAGGAMNYELKKWLLEESIEKKIATFIMYGQTECSPRISCFNLANNPSKINSVGLPIDNCNVFVKDKESNGELLIQGKNVSSGYAENKNEFNSAKYNEKPHLSGDIGYIDEDGFIFITGRAKRFVKIFGHNVNLDHLEYSLKDIYKDIAVIGEDNTIKIFYTAEERIENLIKDEIRQMKAINSRAINMKYIEEIPRLENGKVDYPSLKNY